MDKFDLGETVICSITVKDASSTLQNPSTSTNIVVERLSPDPTEMQSSTAMTNDGTGLYHYDWQTSGGSVTRGKYKFIVTATDGSRISIEVTEFNLK